jgi:hypothetical protein
MLAGKTDYTVKQGPDPAKSERHLRVRMPRRRQAPRADHAPLLTGGWRLAAGG